MIALPRVRGLIRNVPTPFSTEPGNGNLLGNLLGTVDSIIDVNQINAALNNVLGATVDLLNSVDLAVNGVGSGVFDTAPVATTQILELFVAPVHLNLLGARVDTSPIRLSINATTGDGLVLGNVLTALSTRRFLTSSTCPSSTAACSNCSPT